MTEQPGGGDRREGGRPAGSEPPVADADADRRWLAPAALTLEAVLVLLLAPTVARGSQAHAGAESLAVALLGLLLLVAAGLARRSPVPGVALQAGVVATGLVEPVMWVLGLAFAGLYLTSLRLMESRPYRLRGGDADRPRRPG